MPWTRRALGVTGGHWAGISVLVFSTNFSQLGDKEKELANPTKGFFGIFVKKSSYLEKKKLEIVRFRQCVPVGRQN